MKNKEKEDYIRVWFCERCSIYDIDFSNEKIYCSLCGRRMISRTYKEVIKNAKC